MRPEMRPVHPVRTRLFILSETEATWRMTRSCVGFIYLFIYSILANAVILGTHETEELRFFCVRYS